MRFAKIYALILFSFLFSVSCAKLKNEDVNCVGPEPQMSSVEPKPVHEKKRSETYREAIGRTAESNKF